MFLYVKRLETDKSDVYVFTEPNEIENIISDTT